MSQLDISWIKSDGNPNNKIVTSNGSNGVVVSSKDAHDHANQTVLDKVGESAGVPTWNGGAWPGGGAGGGDMYKSVYDTNNDGVVDRASNADNILWSGVQNRPTSSTTDIDDAVTKRHEHTNKTILDNIEEPFTSTQKTKLDGLTNYTHPANHPASMITQDASSRFVTDTQISTWDAKQDALGFTPENSLNKGAVNGYASLDNAGKVPLSQLPSNLNGVTIVDTIADRNALSNAYRVFVKDASADPTVSAGGAEYIFDGTNWIKTSEVESMDIIQDWNNIVNKPTSTVAAIDSAVTNSHTHTNKSVIDKLTEVSGDLVFDGKTFAKGDMEKSVYDTNNNGKIDVAESAESVEWNNVQNKPTSFPVEAHTHTVSDISNINLSISSNADVAANTTARHSHSNISILNGTEESFTTILKNKLDGLTNYTHPASHPATMITEDNTHRFVTDAQITAWENASTASGDMLKSVYDTDNDGKVNSSDFADHVNWSGVNDKPSSTVAAIDSAVTNSHPRSHSIVDSNDHAAANVSDYGKYVRANSTTGAIEFGAIKETDIPSTIAKTSDLHDHSNKSLLDTYTQTESNLANAVANNHSHSNKALLDTYSNTNANISNAITNTHTHTNKTLLDSYTQTESNLSDAVSKRHSHANQTSIDRIGEDAGNPTWNGSAWPGGSGSGTDEKVKASSSDTTAGYLSDKVNGSIIVSSDKLQLSGDNSAPGNSKYYGTNVSGVKGYYDLPAGGTGHTQNTDTGTTSNDFTIGDGNAGNKNIIANTSDASKPGIRYNDALNSWEYSDNGVDFYSFNPFIEYQATGNSVDGTLVVRATGPGVTYERLPLGDANNPFGDGALVKIIPPAGVKILSARLKILASDVTTTNNKHYIITDTTKYGQVGINDAMFTLYQVFNNSAQITMRATTAEWVAPYAIKLTALVQNTSLYVVLSY